MLEELGNTKLTYKGHIDQRLRGGLVSYSFSARQVSRMTYS